MARQDPHFRLRLPEDLKSRIEDAAARNRRTMTSEIIARLESTFSREDVPADVKGIIDEFVHQLITSLDKKTSR
ncbi:Arc family DNA-binding protein [Sinorhizobium meliloti]|uniref:Arc family DNA-binding protein n=1 Tax=Rhizobium meliloti TaxID=382 RepID=UPI000FD93CAB|nr:Arc family DNA-binding protein [Sinorhizobium meliloti]MDW9588689.1 Arc family DNA-binding protein [Sinorhizobium meliloti]RVE84072.1 Arc family DNA-binding protein [Sinorhizobium meliloti]RVH28591.1 Arc family DNA-binding protein [Sinorhizobium meliloti]